MEIYNGMSGKELSDWRRGNRVRAIEEMKKEAAPTLFRNSAQKSEKQLMK